MPHRLRQSPASDDRPASPSQEPDAPYRPQPGHLLAVLWIGEEAELAAYHRGRRLSPVLRRDGIDGPEALEAFVAASVDALAFVGKTASLVLDGEPLQSVALALPPASARRQAQFVREKARRLAAESGELVWEPQRLAAAKTSDKALLHAIDKGAFARIAAAFAKSRLALAKVQPLLSIAPRAFASLGQTPEADSRSLLLASAGSGFRIFSLAPNGRLEFARALSRDNGRDPKRAAVELNRCLLFARQQYGQSVSRIVLAGSAAWRIGENLGQQLATEIPVVQADGADDLWLGQAAARAAPLNLAKERLLQSRKNFAKQAACLAACAACGAFAFLYAYQAELRWRQTRERVERLENREPAMLERLEQLQAREARAAALVQIASDARTFNRPPVERALLALLAKELPPNAWIERLEADWSPESRSWKTRLVAKIEASAEEAERARRRLAEALEASPLRLRSPDREPDALRQVALRGPAVGAQTFSIEGEIPAARPRSDDA